MPTMRERIADLLLGDQKRQLQNMTRTLLEAYQAGPFEPAWTPERLKEVLSEFDSALVQDLVLQLQWERLGTFGYDTGQRESERLRAVRESQRLWEYDVITEWIIALWTNFGFGETVTVTPNDEAAREIWTKFWQAPRNKVLLGSDNLQSLSDNTLVEGESFLAFYVSKLDGLATVRRIGTAEITDIITDPADTGTPLGYKRVFTNQVGGQSQTIYYPDWMAVSKVWTGGVAAEDVFAPANLPRDAKRADTMVEQTDVLMLHVAHKRKGGNRGWPLMTAGAPWIREHKRFRENRASVAEALAMYVQKVKAKGGSRAVDSIRAKLQSSLAIPGFTDAYDRNPPAAPGSTWVENEAATLERLPMGTAAGDARIDGEALLMMAGLAGGVYPHWLGAGESYRLATACYSADTEVLTEWGWMDWRSWKPGIRIATYNHEHTCLDYLEPTQLHRYPYTGSMIAIRGRGVDALVTPNHRMLVLNENNVGKEWACKQFEVLPADQIPSRFAIPTKATVDRRDLGDFILPGHESRWRSTPARVIALDDWLQFLGLWISEGSITKGHSYTVEMAQSDVYPENQQAIRQLLDRLPFNFHEGRCNGNQSRWRCNDEALYRWLEANCGKGARNKHLPAMAFSLSAKQAETFLDALWMGDGHEEAQKHYRGFYTTASKALADGVQILILNSGGWGGVVRSRETWIVHRNDQKKRSFVSIRNITVVDYEGEVWCFEAPPNKMFVTRRNGQPLIAGNTAMEMPTLRNFKRYQNFWAAQFRKMVTIVLQAQERYGSKTFDDKGASVSTDRLLDVDLKAISDAADGLFTNTIQPYWEAGLVPDDTVRKLEALVWRQVVQALGSDDADSLASDEAFGVVPAAEGEDGNTGKVLPFGRSRQRSRQRQREGDEIEMRESGLTIYAGSIRANFRALWSGTWSTGDFILAMLETIALGLRTAWIEGMESAGVSEDEISPKEWGILQERINQENAHITGLAADINASNRAAGGKLGDLMRRAELWVNRYNEILNLSRLTASTDPKWKWNYGPTVDHCFDCSRYEGTVHRKSIWNRVGARPQSPDLECGGWKCKCSLDPTDERATPGLPPRPSGGG